MKAKNHAAAHANFRRPLFVAFLSANLVLSGCVTTALWNAAEGTPGSAHGIKIRRITSASRSSDGKMANVCMAIYDVESRSEREVMLSIPVQDRKKWKIQRNLNGKAEVASNAQATAAPNLITPTYIEYSPTMSALVPGCVADGVPLPVLNSVITDPRKNTQANPAAVQGSSNQKISDAIYVINRDGLPINVGYISDKPLFENSYSIDVPLHYISEQAGTGGKPYLYLLTPVTVAVDAAIVVLYVAALAYGNSGYQYQHQQAPLTIKANSINGISK